MQGFAKLLIGLVLLKVSACFITTINRHRQSFHSYVGFVELCWFTYGRLRAWCRPAFMCVLWVNIVMNESLKLKLNQTKLITEFAFMFWHIHSQAQSSFSVHLYTYIHTFLATFKPVTRAGLWFSMGRCAIVFAPRPSHSLVKDKQWCLAGSILQQRCHWFNAQTQVSVFWQWRWQRINAKAPLKILNNTGGLCQNHGLIHTLGCRHT